MADPPPRSGRDLAWTRRRDALRLVLTGATFTTASRVALVVGTLLTLVNQVDIMLRGDATLVTAVRVLFNYLIPYVVASVGYLAAFRVED